MPRFVDMPGGFVAAPPFLHQGATLHALMLPGDGARMQAMVDNTLNSLPGLRFEVVTDLVLFTALYVSSVTSTDPRWGGRGVAGETDIGFWILTRGGRIGEPPKLRWWPTYLFVDSGPAMAIGRELYGFPKHMSQIERASPDLAGDPAVAVTTQFFRQAAPAERPVTDRLLELRPLAAPLVPPALPGPVAPPFDLPYIAMPMVFLRQFRDARQPDEAIYQAVNSLDVVLKGAKRVGVILTPVELVLHASASHPIALQHGLQPIARPVGPIFRVEMDFLVDRAEVL